MVCYNSFVFMSLSPQAVIIPYCCRWGNKELVSVRNEGYWAARFGLAVNWIGYIMVGLILTGEAYRFPGYFWDYGPLNAFDSCAY